MLRSCGARMILPPLCRLVQNAPEAAGAGGEALEQAVEEAAAAWDEASNGERAPFEAQANGALLLVAWDCVGLESTVDIRFARGHLPSGGPC